MPPADAIAVASATFNTINKWAAGISDTLALGILCEAYGFGANGLQAEHDHQHPAEAHAEDAVGRAPVPERVQVVLARSRLLNLLWRGA